MNQIKFLVIIHQRKKLNLYMAIMIKICQVHSQALKIVEVFQVVVAATVQEDKEKLNQVFWKIYMKHLI